MPRARRCRRRLGRPSHCDAAPHVTYRHLPQRITAGKVYLTDRVINELMGKDASARFRFITEREEAGVPERAKRVEPRALPQASVDFTFTALAMVSQMGEWLFT